MHTNFIDYESELRSRLHSLVDSLASKNSVSHNLAAYAMMQTLSNDIVVATILDRAVATINDARSTNF